MNMPRSALGAAWSLGLFSVFCLGLITCVYQGTQPRITENQRIKLLHNLENLVPDYENSLLDDRIALPNTSIGKLKRVHIYRAYKASKPVAAIFSLITPDGYNGDIHLLIAIRPDSSLIGVRVLSHKETPGLGDLIEEDKSSWILKFNNLSLNSPDLNLWKVKRDGGSFDQFSGATVSPRAIVKSVRDTLLYFKAHMETIFAKS